MALNYEYHGMGDTKKWTKADWRTYESLVWGCMAAGIGELTEHTAAAYVRRVNAMGFFRDARTGAPRVLKVDDIRKFFGLSTNVTTETGTAWARRCMAEKQTEGESWKRKARAAR